MDVVNIADVEAFTTKDGSELPELLAVDFRVKDLDRCGKMRSTSLGELDSG